MSSPTVADADAVLALAVGDPEILLADVRKLEETETLQYARGWLTLVAEELRTELQLALALAPRTTTTKATQWSATFVAALDDGSSGWTVETISKQLVESVRSP